MASLVTESFIFWKSNAIHSKNFDIVFKDNRGARKVRANTSQNDLVS